MDNLKQIPSTYISYRGMELRNLVAEEIGKWLGRGHIVIRDVQLECLTIANLPKHINKPLE